MRKKKLFFVLAMVCLLAMILTAYYWYQKPRQSLAGAAPQYELTAMQLFNAFNEDEAAANQKYLGKIVKIKGEIAQVEQQENTIHILLKGNGTGGVNCTLPQQQSTANPLPREGEQITIKGKCIGFFMDVNLVDALIEN